MKQKLLAAMLFTVVVASPAFADYTLTTLATFNGTNGDEPLCTLIADASGNLYGTTDTGGSGTPSANGTVFEIANGTHALTTLANFSGTNGQDPEAGLVADSTGNLYGTTSFGGNGGGNVFKIAANTHALSTVANFPQYTAGPEGPVGPAGALIVDSAGDLFGTSTEGGSAQGSGGGGTVFEIAAGANTPTILYSFKGGADGGAPPGRLLADTNGNLYGTTEGGSLPSGGNAFGTVFELSPNANPVLPDILTTLATFNGSNGAFPRAGLIMDAQGNLFGTTNEGGTGGFGNTVSGTVFEIAAGTHTLTTLHSFTGPDGDQLDGDLILDANGDLFCTTRGGGAYSDGTVFEIATGTDALTTLYAFDGTDGQGPATGLIADVSGDLYGTTSGNGAGGNDGTVFELSVPEPTSASLLAVGSLSLLVRRRRLAWVMAK